MNDLLMFKKVNIKKTKGYFVRNNLKDYHRYLKYFRYEDTPKHCEKRSSNFSTH